MEKYPLELTMRTAANGDTEWNLEVDGEPILKPVGVFAPAGKQPPEGLRRVLRRFTLGLDESEEA